MKFKESLIAKKAEEALKTVKKFFKSIGLKISIILNGESSKGYDESSAKKEAQAENKSNEQKTKNADNTSNVDNNSKQSAEEQKKPNDDDARQKENASNKTEKKAAQNTCEPSSFREITHVAFLSILDIVASLVFITAIVIAIKPSLLVDNISEKLYGCSYFVERIGETLIKIRIVENYVPKNIAATQHCLIGICLIVFGVLKIYILFAARNGTKKIISVLALAMTYLACFLTGDKFLLFLIFILFLHVIFEYSCGFPSALIFIKLGFIVLLSVFGYVAIHFALDEELVEKATDIFRTLELPKLSWW